MAAQKILILGNENCGLIHNLVGGVHSKGDFSITTAIWQRDDFFARHKYDVILSRPERKKKGFSYALRHLMKLVKWKISYSAFVKDYYTKYDIYIFTWQTLRQDLVDLELLRKNNKKIVFLFIGSEIRWIEAFHQEFPGNPYQGQEHEDWKSKFTLLRTAELNCSSIFSMPDMSTLIVRGYYHMFMPVDINKVKFSPQARTKPIIIHAPSKRDIKGTGIVLEVIGELKKQGIEFEFELLENVENEVVLRKLEEADIVIDQLYLNGPGTLATEGMAAGCAIATRYLKDNKLTGNAPFCYVDEKCLLPSLKKLILDIEYRKDLIAGGYKFVAAHNSPNAIAGKILDSINRDENKDYDYRPTFFMQQFVLPASYQYTDEIKALNDKVVSKYANVSFMTPVV